MQYSHLWSFKEAAMEFSHKSVLLQECVEGLKICPKGIYWTEHWVVQATPLRLLHD